MSQPTSPTLPNPGPIPGTAGIRSVEILPPSARAEAANVLRFAAAIVAVGWIYFANGTGAPGSEGTTARDLAPYQTLFRDLPASEQRTFRELQEGLLEAEAARGTTGAWPDAPALAAQGIAPFAAAPTAGGKSVAYAWSRRQQGTMIDYLGLPAPPSPLAAPAWLLSIQEPDPGAPPDRTPADEQHHRLADGTVLHVAIWSHREGSRVRAALVPLPYADGWTQVLAGTPPSPALAAPSRK